MSSNTYLLPAFYEEGGEAVPVDGSSQAILFSVLGAQAAGGGLTATTFNLTPDSLTGGLLVSYGKTRIGRLPRNLRQTYPQIDHLLNQGVVPEVNANVSITPGSAALNGQLYFPAPVFVIPANTPPAGDWALVPEGEIRQLDTSTGQAEHLIDLNIPAQWLVTLQVVDNRVVAVADGTVFGSLSAYDSADIRGIVDHYQMLSLTPVARCFAYDKDGYRHVVISAASTARMDEKALEPTISPLPAVDPYQPATGEFPMITSANNAQTWAVTVSGDTLAEPVTSTPARPLRAIASPHLPGSAAVVTNPESEPLPEVESLSRWGAASSLADAAQSSTAPAEPSAPAAPSGGWDWGTAAPEDPYAEVEHVPSESTEAYGATDYDYSYGAAPYSSQQPEYQEPQYQYDYQPEPQPEAQPEAEPRAAWPLLGDTQTSEGPRHSAQVQEAQAQEPAAEEPAVQPSNYFTQFKDEHVDDAFPPLPYPNARLGSQFEEDPRNLPAVDETQAIPRVPEDSALSSLHRKPADAEAAPARRVSHSNGSDALDGVPWLAALGVIAGALAVTVATLGYFHITDDLTLGSSTALILLGAGILLVLGSLWFMFRPRD